MTTARCSTIDPVACTATVQAGHPAGAAQTRAGRPRAGPREPRRHRLPVDRRRHLDRDPRHRAAVRQPVEPHRRHAPRHRRRLGDRGRRRPATPTCSTWPASGSARSGILSTVTVQCVPAFNLHAVEQAELVDEVLERLGGRDRRQRPLRVLLGAGHPVGADQAQPPHRRARAEPRRGGARCATTTCISNLAFDVTCRIGRRRPDLIPRVAKLMPSTGPVRVHGAELHGVRQSPARAVLRDGVRHPARAPGRGAQPGARAWCATLGVPISFPVEVRVVAADDIPLSTASGARPRTSRCTCTRARPTTSTSRASSTSWTTTAAGPTGASSTSRRPPRWRPATPAGTTSRPLRARLDPDGRFTSPYLDRILGPVGG